MPTYIMLARWTGEGVSNIKESPTRLDALKQAIQRAGGEVKGFYMVTGQYDMVIITEVPDDETIAKVALATASRGSARTETVRAFTEDEYRKIIGGLP
jgi:uncharacterized protein with GYD domain